MGNVSVRHLRARRVGTDAPLSFSVGELDIPIPMLVAITGADWADLVNMPSDHVMRDRLSASEHPAKNHHCAVESCTGLSGQMGVPRTFK